VVKAIRNLVGNGGVLRLDNLPVMSMTGNVDLLEREVGKVIGEFADNEVCPLVMARTRAKEGHAKGMAFERYLCEEHWILPRGWSIFQRT
jgi:hypothetical protein